MSRRSVGAAIGVLALIPALVAVGRWEGARQTRSQLRGLERVRAAVGPLRSRTLTGVRFTPNYHCLAYQRGVRLYALEICYDRKYRVLEASDRRGSVPHVYSLRLDHNAATIVLPAAEAHAAEESVRRKILRSVWAAPVQSLDLCTKLAAGARHAPSVQKARLAAKSVAGQCRLTVPVVYSNAASALAAGSPAMQAGSLAVVPLLRGYAAALDDFARNPRARRRAYDRAVASLELRTAAIVRTMRTREPWLHMMPRLHR